jgi:membrane fusion protein, multidrug efflux system
VVTPRRQAMPMVIEFSGPLVAPRTAIVRAKASGTLLSLAVGEGSRVKAGQVLGRIDLSDLESRVTDRSAAVESAQVALKDAERQHEANLRLSNENFISSTALQSSQAKLDGARAALKGAEAQLATSRIGVRDAALVAPIDGIVGKRHVVPGERVSAEQMVVTLVDLSTLELLGAVGTHEVSLLQVGQPVDLTIENQPQSTTKQRNARIDRIAPSAEPGTRAIGVVVALENPAERLRAGQYGQARVVIDDREQRLTVPIAAVTQTSGQDQVWTLENGALVRRIVITGRRDIGGGRVEVLRGLPDDARLLAVRFDNLKEGVLASVANKPREAASVAASNAPRS